MRYNIGVRHFKVRYSFMCIQKVLEIFDMVITKMHKPHGKTHAYFENLMQKKGTR